MRFLVRIRPHLPLPFSVDLSSEHRAEPVLLGPQRFVADIDTELVQRIFDISQRKWKTNVQHHRKADDLGTGFELLERRRSGHFQTLRNRPDLLKQS